MLYNHQKSAEMVYSQYRMSTDTKTRENYTYFSEIFFLWGSIPMKFTILGFFFQKKIANSTDWKKFSIHNFTEVCSASS